MFMFFLIYLLEQRPDSIVRGTLVVEIDGACTMCFPKQFITARGKAEERRGTHGRQKQYIAYSALSPLYPGKA
jgi:hypothetical protein